MSRLLTIAQESFPGPPTTERLDSSSASSLPSSETCNHRKLLTIAGHVYVFLGNKLLTIIRSVQTMQNYIQPALNALRNPSTLFSRLASEANSATQQSPANVIAQIRNIPSAQWYSIGVVAAEVIGFFSVGEIIGRFKLVGYRTKKDEHH